jgi:hypothetical protein
MTTPTGVRAGVGFRHCQILALSSGYPAATGATAYDGVQISGARSLTITDPEPRNITFQGDDTIFALDVLPPTEAVTGELRVSKTNDAVDAVLAPDKSIAIGDAKFFGIGTDNRGSENQVCMVAYRQALEATPGNANFGGRQWEFRMFPKVILSRRESNLDENPEDRAYTITPQFVSAYPWGTAFSTTTEGFTRAQVLRGVSEYRPRLVGWLGTGAAETFAFNASYPSAATSKVAVWVNGTLKAYTTDFTALSTAVIFVTAPASDAHVVAFYETTAA